MTPQLAPAQLNEQCAIDVINELFDRLVKADDERINGLDVGLSEKAALKFMAHETLDNQRGKLLRALAEAQAIEREIAAFYASHAKAH